MRNRFFIQLSLRVTIIFTIAILHSFIPEMDFMREFFGDTPSADRGFMIDEYWNWGGRHYFYHWLMVVLFILSFINLFSWVNVKDRRKQIFH